MYKNYITPQMEITEFDSEDVITTSSGIPDGGNNEYENPTGVVDP